MSNSAPYEIIVGPFEVYLAATGTAFPDVDETPGVAWTLLGAGGKKDMNESGVTVTHEQTVERDAFRMLGTTGARKAVRTSEDLMVEFVLHDLTPEMYSYALNGNAVTTTAAGVGTPGTRSIPLHQGMDVTLYAMLVKGQTSPYGDSPLATQFQVPVCYQDENPAPVFAKGEPAGLAFKFVSLEDPNASEGSEFGTLVVQDAVAS
jgi:hypothetical protein